MKTVCIVQARMGSSRLPGKVLLPLNGSTVIGEVLKRCKRIAGVDDVIAAISEPRLGEFALFDECLKHVDRVYTADRTEEGEGDVLGRYYNCAHQYNADIIMRITGDCPLISSELCEAVLFEQRSGRDGPADYASNIEPRTFPKGLDCEVFTMEILDRAHREATRPEDREHVTPWMLRSSIKRRNVASPWKIDGRLTLDTWDDYKTICAAFGHEVDERLRAA